MKNKIIAIVGPTASGKTEASIKAASFLESFSLGILVWATDIFSFLVLFLKENSFFPILILTLPSSSFISIIFFSPLILIFNFIFYF